MNSWPGGVRNEEYRFPHNSGATGKPDTYSLALERERARKMIALMLCETNPRRRRAVRGNPLVWASRIQEKADVPTLDLVPRSETEEGLRITV